MKYFYLSNQNGFISDRYEISPEGVKNAFIKNSLGIKNNDADINIFINGMERFGFEFFKDSKHIIWLSIDMSYKPSPEYYERRYLEAKIPFGKRLREHKLKELID